MTKRVRPDMQRTGGTSASSFLAPFSKLKEIDKDWLCCSRLQAAAVAFGESLPIPEIVAIGGQSDGKSSLLEAFLGFRFNVREVEMGTRRYDHIAHLPGSNPSTLRPTNPQKRET